MSRIQKAFRPRLESLEGRELPATALAASLAPPLGAPAMAHVQ
jgi:hypothetical protein